MRSQFDVKKSFGLRLFVVVILTLLICQTVSLAATEISPQSSVLHPYTKVKLPNRLTLIVKEVHSAPIATVDIWVATGAKNELPEEAGISHFFEHMLFKGTAKRKVGEIAKQIQAVGGYTNAQTSLDTTHYYVVVPSEHIDLALDIEADAIMNSSFDPAEIERERKVILEERSLKEDNPPRKLGMMAYQAAFKGTPYANDILGTSESLSRFDRDSFIDYYHKYYSPSNMVVVVVGDVETNHVIEQVQKLFQDFTVRPKTVSPPFKLPKLKAIQRVEAEKRVDQTYLYFGFPGPGMNDKDTPALSILGVILGGGQSSRFYQSILEEKRLANTIASGYQAYQKIGMMAVYAQIKDTKVPDLENEVQSILRQVITKGVSEEELQRAKALVRSNIAYTMESNADIAAFIGEYQVNEAVEDATKFTNELMKVNPKDIQRVAKKYLNPRAYVLAIVKPQGVK